MPRAKKKQDEKAKPAKAGGKKPAGSKAAPKKAETAAKSAKTSVTKPAKKVTATAGGGKMKKETSKKTVADIRKKSGAKPPKKTEAVRPKRAPVENAAAPPQPKPAAPREPGPAPAPQPRPETAPKPGPVATAQSADRTSPAREREESRSAKEAGNAPGGEPRTEAETPPWRMVQESPQYQKAPAPRDVLEEVPPLPEGYGETRIVLLPIDPDWVHAYWEITGASLDEARRNLGHYFDGAERTLRVRRIQTPESGGSAEQFYLTIGDLARNWYVKVPQPDAVYQADIGLVTSRGEFYVLATSNQIRVPRRGMSDVIDEKWTDPEQGYFEKIYALSGGLQVGMGSLELQQKMAELLKGEISSGAVGSFAMGSGAIGVKKERGFWMRVGAELIVYGATDPRAKVTLMGQPIQLRPDGTFSARFALPDGLRDIPITAESPDKVEEREIDITVTRETLEKEPVFK